MEWVRVRQEERGTGFSGWVRSVRWKYRVPKSSLVETTFKVRKSAACRTQGWEWTEKY